MKRGAMSRGAGILAAILSSYGTAARADVGSPDAFGYRWIDTEMDGAGQAILFDDADSWVELAPVEGGSGTAVSALRGQDNAEASVPIGFGFPFYGSTYTNVWLTSNGLLVFTNGAGASSSNMPIPDVGAPQNFIAAFWDDLAVDTTTSVLANVFYQTRGTNGAREFIAEWYQVVHANDRDARYTFEAILYEGSGDIRVQYKDMQNGTGLLADGRSATLGIENAAGTGGVPYVYNEADGIERHSGVLFTTGNLSIAGQVTYSGSQTGVTMAAVFRNANDNLPAFVCAALNPPTPYLAGNLLPGTYYVVAVLMTDLNNGEIWLTDPWGFHGGVSNPTPVVAGPTATNADVAVSDGGVTNPNPFGASGRYLDFDGDGKADLGLDRASSGYTWYHSSFDADVHTLPVGNPAWIPAPADYDGDGFTDYSWFLPATAVWRVYESSRGYAERLPRVTIGGPNDIPVPADFDGDGRADLAVFRRGSGKYWVRLSTTSNLVTSSYGQASWLPAIADFDGDGRADMAWFVPATQMWRVYPANLGWFYERLPRDQFGGANDIPIPADFDGDGRADLAVFRRGSGKIWYKSSVDTFTYASAVGSPTWLPTVADYDRDGKADYSWFIPATQTWRVYESSRGYAERPRVKMGGLNDWPVATPRLGW